MDEDILVCSYSAASRRHAMLVDDGTTGILYLHAPSKDPARPGEVEGSTFAYNRVEPIDMKDVPGYRPNPPPIAKDYASNLAVCRDPKKREWQLKWSATGDAALLLRDDEPWAIVSLEHPQGFSKALQKQGG